MKQPMEEQDLRQIPPLSLAHIGDAVYELLARIHALGQGIGRPETLHRRTVRLVSAEAQSAATKELMEIFTEREREMFVRGRNAKPKSTPKHAAGGDYHYSSGLEAVFGMLYLLGEHGRILELWDHIARSFEQEG